MIISRVNSLLNRQVVQLFLRCIVMCTKCFTSLTLLKDRSRTVTGNLQNIYRVVHTLLYEAKLEFNDFVQDAN